MWLELVDRLDIAISTFCQHKILWFGGEKRGNAVDTKIPALEAEMEVVSSDLSTGPSCGLSTNLDRRHTGFSLKNEPTQFLSHVVLSLERDELPGNPEHPDVDVEDTSFKHGQQAVVALDRS